MYGAIRFSPFYGIMANNEQQYNELLPLNVRGITFNSIIYYLFTVLKINIFLKSLLCCKYNT